MASTRQRSPRPHVPRQHGTLTGVGQHNPRTDPVSECAACTRAAREHANWNTTPVLPPEQDPDWMDNAACRTTTAAVFFSPRAPGHVTNSDDADRLAIKLYCSNCPVITVCDAYATAAHINHGVWGGKTEAERRKLTPDHRNRGIPT